MHCRQHFLRILTGIRIGVNVGMREGLDGLHHDGGYATIASMKKDSKSPFWTANRAEAQSVASDAGLAAERKPAKKHHLPKIDRDEALKALLRAGSKLLALFSIGCIIWTCWHYAGAWFMANWAYICAFIASIVVSVFGAMFLHTEDEGEAPVYGFLFMVGVAAFVALVAYNPWNLWFLAIPSVVLSIALITV